MANIIIGLSKAFADTDRVLLSACVSNVLVKTLNLPVTALSFQFEEIPAVDDLLALSVQIHLFPACSGRMRRTACSETVNQIAQKLRIASDMISVQIISPPQERAFR